MNFRKNSITMDNATEGKYAFSITRNKNVFNIKTRLVLGSQHGIETFFHFKFIFYKRE